MSETIEDFERIYGTLLEQPPKALLWQHNKAQNIQDLLQGKVSFYADYYSQFWCWYLFEYFYLGDSTSAEGVTIWSILLDLGIEVTTEDNNTDVFGFGPNNENFNNAPFGRSSSAIGLPLEYAILALRLRFFQLTNNCSVTNINRFFVNLLGWTPENPNGQKIIVIDNFDMTITYRLNFEPDANLQFIFNNLDLLPRPAAVGVNWEVQAESAFGFGPENERFNQAPFGA